MAVALFVILISCFIKHVSLQEASTAGPDTGLSDFPAERLLGIIKNYIEGPWQRQNESTVIVEMLK